jgi:hypothetical protein
MNVPNCTLSEGMFIRKANLRHFTASRGFLFTVSTGNLQALSIVSGSVWPQDTSRNLGGANAPSKKNLEAP